MVCSFSPILSVVPYERIGSLLINLVLVFVNFLACIFLLCTKLKLQQFFCLSRDFNFFNHIFPSFAFLAGFCLLGLSSLFFVASAFLILFLCFFFNFFEFLSVIFVLCSFPFFISAFPTPPCASPLSALFFLRITPPFCVLTLLPNPAPCSHLFLLLSILDAPCLSSFRVSVFFPWLIESGELLLEINAPSLLVREAQEAHAKAETILHPSLLKPCSSHDKTCR